MKKLFLGLLLPLLLIVFYWTYTHYLRHEEPVHYHAGFLVYINGAKQDFSGYQYMHIEKCTNDSHVEDDQLEKAHLHDGIGDVVHVHRAGAVWGDLFKNINFSFPNDLSITGYANGQTINDILQKPIEPNESVIIVVGNNNNIDLNGYVPLSHIQEVESKSESCGN